MTENKFYFMKQEEALGNLKNFRWATNIKI